MTHSTWLDRLPVLATMLCATAEGALASVATHDVALATGAVGDTTLAWALPIIIEGGAITAGLLAWRRTRTGQGAWTERLALLVLILLGTVVNASHASGASALGVVLAASPPLVVVGSIELLLRSRSANEVVAARQQEETQARAARERRAARVRERAVSTPPMTGDRPVSTPTLRVAGGQDAASERAALIDAMLAETGGLLTGTVVAERLGVSPATGRRMLAAARARATGRAA